VFIKNFDLTVDETKGTVRRLETRLLVRDEIGGVYGATYRWRADNSDADLVVAPQNEDISITNSTGTRMQTWYYPGPLDCLVCHTPNSGSVLGVNARQLNGRFTYAETGVTDNQLRTWNHLGLFDSPLDENTLTNFPALASVTDTNYPVEYRVRSYLDSNCSQCHRPNGAATYFDARFSTPLEKQKLIDGPIIEPMGDLLAHVITAGDVPHSALHTRINRVGALQMPPLARNVIDSNAVNAVAEWIKSLPTKPVAKSE
jgi:mono/diheme cytochrome c family protein